MIVNKINNFYVFIILLIIIFFININFLNNYFPTRDSLHYHFNSFQYISEFLKQYYFIPYNFPAEGGFPIVFSNMSFGLLAPHKILSFFTYIISNNILIGWKFGIIFAIVIYSFGIYIIAFSYTGNLVFSIALGLYASSFGISASFHQEQVLYTAIFLPAIFLLIKATISNPEKLSSFFLGACIGLVSFTHFPQIYLTAILVIIYLTYDKTISFPHKRILIKYLIFLSFGFFSTSFLFLFFLYNQSDIIYPLRVAKGILNNPSTLKDFLSMISVDGSNGFSHCRDFYSCFSSIVIKPNKYIDDLGSLYVGPTLIIFIPLIFIFSKRYFFSLLFVFLLFIGPSLDIFGVTSLIFQFVFRQFRQWYHFFPLFFFIFTLSLTFVYLKLSPKSKKYFITLLLLSALVNIYNNNKNLSLFIQKDVPPVFFDENSLTRELRNPNLLNSTQQVSICKENYVRVEPYQYPKFLPIGIITNDKLEINKYCLNSISSKNASNPISVYPLYSKHRSTSLVNTKPINEKFWVNISQNAGMVENFEVLSSGSITLHGWAFLNSKKMSSILIGFNGNFFTCTPQLNRPDINPSSPGNIGFQCTIPIDRNLIIDFQKISIRAVSGKFTYQLDRCCGVNELNKIIFLEITNNAYWKDFIIDIKNLDLIDKFIYLFQNSKYNKFQVTGNISQIESKLPTFFIQGGGAINISMPNSILLTIYFIWSFFISYLIIYYAYCVKSSFFPKHN
jgi:hypothetical protein